MNEENQNRNAEQNNAEANQSSEFQDHQAETNQESYSQNSGSTNGNHQNESGGQFDFKNPQYGRDAHGINYSPNPQNYDPNMPPHPPIPKKPSLGKEIGLFAAKAAIGAVIGVGVLALAGTIALNATNKNVYIVDKDKTVTIGESGDDGNTIPFGSFGFGGQGNSNGSGNGSSQDDGSGRSEDGDNDQDEEQDSDDDGPKLGIKVETMPDELAEAGYPEGVLVADVTEGGAADQAGIKTGDIITAFNGTVVKSADELVELVQDAEVGDTVKVNYKRMENGTFKAYDADVTFSDQTDSSASGSEGTQSDSSDSSAASSSESTESD